MVFGAFPRAPLAEWAYAQASQCDIDGMAGNLEAPTTQPGARSRPHRPPTFEIQVKGELTQSMRSCNVRQRASLAVK